MFVSHTFAVLFECLVEEEHEVVDTRAELSWQADSEFNLGGSSETMYYIGLDVHKRTISYCVKDAAGHVDSEGKIGSTRHELDAWVRTLPRPRTIAMEATIFTGWIYLHGCRQFGHFDPDRNTSSCPVASFIL